MDSSIYAVSDVHGHLDDLRAGLHDAGLVTPEGVWSGGDSQLWVLGDLLDRGPDGLAVIGYLRHLHSQAPDQVHVLLGNHEALALGKWLFPDSGFDPVWRRNGGLAADQGGLTSEDIAWLTSLPALGRAGDLLLMHSDTTSYLAWGSTIDEVNATVSLLLSGDEAQVREVWRGLVARLEFTGVEGPARVKELLAAYGGSRVVHGHSIITTLPDVTEVTGPHEYAEGLALAIDGGRYAGGPLLVVRL